MNLVVYFLVVWGLLLEPGVCGVLNFLGKNFFTPDKKKALENLKEQQEAKQKAASPSVKKENNRLSFTTSSGLASRDVYLFLQKMDPASAFFGTPLAGEINTYWASEINVISELPFRLENTNVIEEFQYVSKKTRVWRYETGDDAQDRKNEKQFIRLVYMLTALQKHDHQNNRQI